MSNRETWYVINLHTGHLVASVEDKTEATLLMMREVKRTGCTYALCQGVAWGQGELGCTHHQDAKRQARRCRARRLAKGNHL